MSTPPSILVVDDGELVRVHALLQRLGVDFVHHTRPDRKTPLQRPHDLLLTSGARAMKMPPLEGEGAPIWACIYDQDFPPLRERLRELGVHYLVSGDLASRTFELFLRQLLHRGEERRRNRRIPLRCEIELDRGVERWTAHLLELSRESCVLVSDRPLLLDEAVVVRLPARMTGGRRLDLSGRIVRAGGGAEPEAGDDGCAVLAFEDLDPDAAALIHDIVTGHARGTQVTPLAPEVPEPPETRPASAPESDGSGGDWAAGDEERRGAPRRVYGRRVEAIRWHGEEGPGPRVSLGRDLSLSGLRVEASPPPTEGTAVSLALYGGAREEPILVEARVVRVRGEEVALHFPSLTREQRRGLERLMRGSPHLETLDDPAEGSASVHVVEILPPA